MRKALGVLSPGELAAVDDDAAESRAVSAHEFRQRMHNDVGPVLERAQQNGSGDRIIDKQWHAILMGNLRKRFEIANVPRRVSDAFAEHRSGIVVNQLLR